MHNYKNIQLLAYFIFLLSFNINGQDDITRFIKPEHPRLLINHNRLEEIRILADTDTLLSELIQIVKNYADSALTEPVIKYEFDGPDNPRLKEQRRAAMFRVFNCGLTYLLTSDTVYANRAKLDLLEAADFPDWASWHFLNVGEISAFMGIGYDWLFHYLTESEKIIIRKAIVKHGLSQGILAYAGKHQDDWWVNQAHNINQVCSGGMSLAALAIAEDNPDTASLIIQGALSSIPPAMAGYLPDGAWREGPTYWAYGTTYNGLFLSALRSACDSLFGMDKTEGYPAFGKSGAYHIHTVGPTNLYFNFGDSKDIMYYSPILFWLSEEFNEPGYAWYERNICINDLTRMKKGGLMGDDTLDRFLALLVAWYSDKGKKLTYDDFPLDAKFTGEDVALGAFHSEWSREGIYFAFKGGKPNTSHSHMDIGSFVMDAKGERWAMDLGYGNNLLPGFSDYNKTRWTYFYNNNFSHNTLVFFNYLQNKDAFIPVSEFYSDPGWAYASLNMTPAYSLFCSECTRKYWFPDRREIQIIDEITPVTPYVDVRWAMVTPGEILLNGNEALLRQNGREFKVTIQEPAGVEFIKLSTKPPKPEEEYLEGTTMLALKYYFEDLNPFKIKVTLSPYDTLLTEPSNINWQSISTGHPVLFNNHPNPFQNETMIMFDLPFPEYIHLDIYDLSGRKVRSLLDGIRTAGRNVIYWNGTSDSNTELSPGMYLLQLSYPIGQQSIRMVKY